MWRSTFETVQCLRKARSYWHHRNKKWNCLDPLQSCSSAYENPTGEVHHTRYHRHYHTILVERLPKCNRKIARCFNPVRVRGISRASNCFIKSYFLGFTAKLTNLLINGRERMIELRTTNYVIPSSYNSAVYEKHGKSSSLKAPTESRPQTDCRDEITEP